MTKRRVVVTGMGINSPVGNTIKTAWQNIVSGISGIAHISSFDVTNFASKIAGEVRDLDLSPYIPRKDLKKMDRFIHLGIAAGTDALHDSGFEVNESNQSRIGVAVGAGIGGINTIEKTCATYAKGGPRKISPFFVPSTIINMISGHLSIIHGLKGPNISVVTACTTATHNIGLAARIIAYGDADIMLAGGAEHSISATAVGGFSSAKALSCRNDAPQEASRPWDVDRDGFVIAEGAGVLVLEERDAAKARGAHIYAELCGFGMSGDAFHMTAPLTSGDGAKQCMIAALNDAQLNSDQVNYINAHGTSTAMGDKAESDAVKSTYGHHAYQLAVSSTKSMTGHLLGAAGGVEAIFSILALADQVAPPTINLQHPSDGCDLNYVPNRAQEMKIDYAMSNSFGFGGSNGTLIFKRG